MAADKPLILPVILSGGSGMRLWPLSRKAMPKQFQHILGSKQTLLQQTFARVENPALFAPPLVIGHEDHRFIIQQNAVEAGAELSAILLEPEGRDTAAAVVTAALWAEGAGYAHILILPSDHVIEDTKLFQENIAAVKNAPDTTYFGIVPDHPHTGYGYIEPDAHGNVVAFHEKPDAASAQKLITERGALWNSGIFLIPLSKFIQDMRTLDNAFVEQAKNSLDAGLQDLGFFRLSKDEYKKIPAIEFDKAYCEKIKKGKVARAGFSWSDVGSWDAVHSHSERNKDNTATHGNVICSNVKDSLISSDGVLLGVSGVENMVVIATKDAVLVADKNNAQDIRSLVQNIKAQAKPQADHYFIVHRPWGSYEVMNESESSRVIRMRIAPKGRLSMQLHRKRSEHWVVVSGELTVTKDKSFTLKPGESGFAAPAERHRLENAGDAIVEFIEVQTGVILDDDIERFDQVY